MRSLKSTKKLFHILASAILAIWLISCSQLNTQSSQSKIIELELKAKLMMPVVESYGKGGVEVFNTAVEGLKQAYKEGKNDLVSIEDLWTHALQEGAVLFNQPDRLWGPTPAEETADMIGQLTVGPWQMTDWNIQKTYGPPYGLPKKANKKETLIWCRNNPVLQARMIADYIQLSYKTYGKRSPYGIQRYFWLDAYVKGEIGQSPDWWKSPVAKPPKGMTWKDLTPEMKQDTGFYAKQVVCGHPHQQRGILYWLARTNDVKAIDELLKTWHDEPKRVWNAKKDFAEPTAEKGNFTLAPTDLKYWIEDDIDTQKIVIERMNVINNNESK